MTNIFDTKISQAAFDGTVENALYEDAKRRTIELHNTFAFFRLAIV